VSDGHARPCTHPGTGKDKFTTPPSQSGQLLEFRAYRPIVDRSGTILMAESLMRWPHPQHGMDSAQ